MGQRQRLRSQRCQQEEGDKDARPPVLTAKSLAGASTQNQKCTQDREPQGQVREEAGILRHGENVEGEPARQGHHELIQLREVREQGGRGEGVGTQEQQYMAGDGLIVIG